MSIKSQIKKSSMTVFRRILMKRRGTDGEYEANWQTLPSYSIKKFGSIDKGIDPVRQNHYASSGFNFEVENTDGYYSDIAEDKSFFFGQLSRYRTLVKVEAGYIDDDGSELPTDPSLFVGLLKPDMPYTHNNLIKFGADHLDQIFKEFPSDRVPGLGAVQTAKSIIEKIRDTTDGADNLIFQKYISSGGWNITSSSRTYNIATTASLEGKSVWDFMKQLSEAENNMLFIDRRGSFNFIEKDASGTSVYHFSGIGDSDNTYGRNILKNISVDDDIRNVYNRVRIKYDKADTSGSYKIKNESWTWGDSSSSNKYGIKTYEYENLFMTEAVASETAITIFDEYSTAKQVVQMQTKFVPQLDILDIVDATYSTVVRTGNALWGKFTWDNALWGERSGKNIDIDGDYKITKITHNLGNFTTKLNLRGL
jgi:hypothetical protein